jgi:hypothetical protein
MTVEAYLRAQVAGYPWDISTLEAVVLSPIFAKPSALQSIALSDVVEDISKDEQLVKSLKYAISTLYYTVAGVFSGGSQSEQIADVKISVSGYEVTQSDREYYRKLASNLREEIGCEAEADLDDNGLFDASNLRCL